VDLAAFCGSLGFVASGVASLEPSRRADALTAWLNAGYGGTMRYLHRRAAKRRRPGEIVLGAKAAVVVLDNYYQEAGEPGSHGVKVARYARGEDYHRVLYRRLEHIAAWLVDRGATIAHPWTDNGPVPERELAERAGLGWIGKNSMLIRPQSGSFLLIGSVFTDLPIEAASIEAPDRCGSCTRCLDACPTEAFVAPRVLDATRCISYLTIESRAPIPEALTPRLEGWGFGCDICNEVCPWNVRFAETTSIPEYRERQAPDLDDPEYFDRMSEGEFASRFADTPLERPGLAGMRRNWRAAFASRRPRSPDPAPK
jgi:epoxyqueuosine reductase